MKRSASKFTKIVALTLMVAMLLSLVMPMAAAWQAPLPNNQLFPDSRNHWAGRDGYIGWAMANNITTGFGDNTFRPNATRGETVAWHI